MSNDIIQFAFLPLLAKEKVLCVFVVGVDVNELSVEILMLQNMLRIKFQVVEIIFMWNLLTVMMSRY